MKQEIWSQCPRPALLYNQSVLKNTYRHYVQPIRGFHRDTRLFLWMTVINGIILSGWQLFFNIYILQSGYSREFLGLINSLPSLTGLLLGIPMGRISDRVGRKPAMIVGIVCSGLAMLGQITFHQQALIAVMAGLTGIFNMLLLVSLSPLMMKLSGSGESYPALQSQLWIADTGRCGRQSLCRAAPRFVWGPAACQPDQCDCLSLGPGDQYFVRDNVAHSLMEDEGAENASDDASA